MKQNGTQKRERRMCIEKYTVNEKLSKRVVREEGRREGKDLRSKKHSM